MDDLDFRITHIIEPNEQAVIEFGIDAANLEAIATSREPLNVCVYALDSVVAGVTGYTIGTNLIVKALWVDNAFRSQGVARRLMDTIEAEAQDKGCKVALVDIMSYQEMARLPGFHDDYDRIFMQKNLG